MDSSSRETLQNAIKDQGDVVRKLKAEKATKEKVICYHVAGGGDHVKPYPLQGSF
jgi:hypothetical protein